MPKYFSLIISTCLLAAIFMVLPANAVEKAVVPEVPDKQEQAPSVKNKAIYEKFKGVQKEIEGISDEETEEIISGGELNSKKATGLFIKMIFGMIFIILLIVLSIRWLKHLQKSSLLGKKSKLSGRIEVLETCYLGKDQKVVLVSLGDKELALGVTPAGIQLLKETEQTGQKELTEKTVALGGSHEQLDHFRDNLNGFLSKYSRPKTVSQSLEEL